MRSENAPYGHIHISYDLDSQEPFIPVTEKMSRKDILSLLLTSGILGICVLLFHYIGEGFTRWIVKLPVMENYMTSDALFNAVQIAYSLICIIIPFGIGALFLRLVHRKTELMPLRRPNSKGLFMASLGIGFLALVVSNYITTFFVLAAEGSGVYFDSGESEPADTLTGFLWQVLSTAIVPALAEEFAVRGVILQSLRKYGDRFAIFFSAFIFALLHGNMVQAPFALLLGCILGWVVIVTDSLWTGIAIHFMNNFYATVMTSLGETMDQYVYVALFLVVNFIGVLLGVYAVIVTSRNYKGKFSYNTPGGNTPKAQRLYRIQAYVVSLVSVPMAAAVIILIREIASRIHVIG